MILTMNQEKMDLGGKYLGWLREANTIYSAIAKRFKQGWERMAIC